MVCKLYTPMYMDHKEIQYAYHLGTILEEIYEGCFTGLRLKIVFFNGDIDFSSSLHLSPYYILEYLSSETFLIPSSSIFDQLPSDVAVGQSLQRNTWKRSSNMTLERCIDGTPTGTFAEIMQNSEGKDSITASPWLNTRHLSSGDIESSKRFVVVECRAVHDLTRWRRAG